MAGVGMMLVGAGPVQAADSLSPRGTDDGQVVYVVSYLGGAKGDAVSRERAGSLSDLVGKDGKCGVVGQIEFCEYFGDLRPVDLVDHRLPERQCLPTVFCPSPLYLLWLRLHNGPGDPPPLKVVQDLAATGRLDEALVTGRLDEAFVAGLSKSVTVVGISDVAGLQITG
jgi:hypothetical protein